MLAACGRDKNNADSSAESAAASSAASVEADSAITDSANADSTETYSAETDTATSSDSNAGDDTGKTKDKTDEMLQYVDAAGEMNVMAVNHSISPNIYDKNAFQAEGDDGVMTYKGEGYESLQGIDVSEHQGLIDWEAVAGDGIDFAVIRVGYRGYGEEGTLMEDATAVDNLRGAKAAGIPVGAYFFSQAIRAQEAAEEAELACEIIEKAGVELDLPLFYDAEKVKGVSGRANSITRAQVSENVKAFRGKAEERGIADTAIYTNLKWEAFMYEPEILSQTPIWYADYQQTPQTPYHFTWWQYSEKGSVAGVEGAVDRNLWIRPVE